MAQRGYQKNKIKKMERWFDPGFVLELRLCETRREVCFCAAYTHASSQFQTLPPVHHSLHPRKGRQHMVWAALPAHNMDTQHGSNLPQALIHYIIGRGPSLQTAMLYLRVSALDGIFTQRRSMR